MSYKAILLSAVVGTGAFFPVTAFAQTQEDCDLLLTQIQEGDANQIGLSEDDVAVLVDRGDFAACQTALAQIQESGAVTSSRDAQGVITIDAAAPTITVDQEPPVVDVEQAEPDVTVRQAQPQIQVIQPAPTVTVDIPQPQIIVRMPDPEVAVSQAQPRVSVSQPEPQINVQQPQQPTIDRADNTGQAIVRSSGDTDSANVQIEETDSASVDYQSEEAQVIVNQAEGQPQVQFEQMSADETEQQNQMAMNQQIRDNAELVDVNVSDLEGMTVVNGQGEQIGEAEMLVLSSVDNREYLVINHGGFLGLGEKTIALSAADLGYNGEDIVVPGLTDEQIEGLSEFEMNDSFTQVDNAQVVEFQTM